MCRHLLLIQSFDATIQDKIFTVAYKRGETDTILHNFDLSTGKAGYIGSKKLIHQIDSILWDDAYNNVDRHEEVLHFLENGKARKYGYRNNIYYLSKDKTISQTSFNNKLGTLIFENKEKKERVEQVVYFRGSKSGAFIFFTPDHFYFGSEHLNHPFKPLDLKYNRPDIVLNRLGYADSTVIAKYKNDYLNRLEAMQFTDKMLQTDFHLPEVEIENIDDLAATTKNKTLKLSLRVKDSKYPLDRINILINKVAIKGPNGIWLRGKNIQGYQTKVKIPLVKGENRIQISVLNQAGAESYKEHFTIHCTAR